VVGEDQLVLDVQAAVRPDHGFRRRENLGDDRGEAADRGLL
jgi:hypothetical protein